MFVDTSPVGALPPWRGDLKKRAATLLKEADILGLDIYPVRPIQSGGLALTLSWPSWVWESRVQKLQQMAQTAGRQIWVSEAQAEPWVPAKLRPGSWPSQNALPAGTVNTVGRLRADGFNTFLFWGVEYWYMRFERYKDGDWWTGMQPFFGGPSALTSTS